MKCRMTECNSVGVENCGRTVICTGSCKKGTSSISRTICIKGEATDECETTLRISCGSRQSSPCTGWPDCGTCDNWTTDGVDLYVDGC